MGNISGAGGNVSQNAILQYLDLKVAGGKVFFYWSMVWDPMPHSSVSAGVVFQSQLTYGGYSPLQTLTDDPGKGKGGLEGMKEGMINTVVLNQYFSYKMKSGQQGAALEAYAKSIAPGGVLTEGAEILIGTVKLHCYIDINKTIRVDFSKISELDKNPSSADIYYVVKSSTAETKARLQLCFPGEVKIKNNMDGCKPNSPQPRSCSEALKGFDDILLSDVPFDELGFDLRGGTPPGNPDFLSGCVSLRYKAHTDPLWDAGLEIDDYYPCYWVSCIGDDCTGGKALQYSSDNLHMAGVCGMVDSTCTKSRETCCDKGTSVGSCVPSNAAWFDDTAMSFVVAAGMDPRSLSSEGLACAMAMKDRNGKKIDGILLWKRFSSYGRRKGQTVHGSSNTVWDETKNDTITAFNMNLDPSVVNLKSWCTVTQQTVYEGFETWKQMFTVFEPGSKYGEILKAEKGNPVWGGGVVPDDAEFKEMALEQLTTIASSMGFGISGDNYDFSMEMATGSTTGPTSETRTMGVTAVVSKKNMLQAILGKKIIAKDVVTCRVSYRIDGAIEREVFVDTEGQTHILDKNPADGTTSTVKDMKVNHQVYFLNGWEVDYGVGIAYEKTETIDGVSHKVHRYFGAKVKKKFWNNRLIFTAGLNKRGLAALSLYINPKEFTFTSGKCKWVPQAGVVYESGKFEPTFGCNFFYTDALKISWDALSSSGKALFHHSIELSKESPNGDGRDLTMNIFGSKDLGSGAGGSSVGLDVTYKDTIIQSQRLKSKIYLKGKASATLNVGLPGSGLMASQGISFHAGASVALVYEADWLRYLDIPFIVGFGPAFGFALSSYTNARGLVGQGMSGTAWDMVMGPFFLSFAIINQFAHEMRIRHHALLRDVPILGTLFSLIPGLSTLGDKESTDEYIARVVPTRTAKIITICKQEYDALAAREIPKVKIKSDNDVRTGNLDGWLVASSCDKAKIQFKYEHAAKLAWFKGHRFCDYLNTCFHAARMETVAGSTLSAYKTVADKANWDHDPDKKGCLYGHRKDANGNFIDVNNQVTTDPKEYVCNSRSRRINVNDMLNTEEMTFDAFKDADVWADVVEAASKVSGSILNKMVAVLSPSKVMGNLGKKLMWIFSGFITVIKVILKAATLGLSTKLINRFCDKHDHITKVEKKAREKALGLYGSMRNCTGITKLKDCWLFLSWLETVKKGILYMKDFEMFHQNLLRKTSPCAGAASNVQAFQVCLGKLCNEPFFAGLDAADQQDWINKYVLGIGFGNRNGKDTLQDVRDMFQTGVGSILAGFCKSTAYHEIWDQFEDAGECIVDLEGWAYENCTPDIAKAHGGPCQDDSAGFNPCIIFDYWQRYYNGWIINCQDYYDLVGKIVYNPMLSKVNWDVTPTNFGQGSFTSIQQAKQEVQNLKTCICGISTQTTWGRDCYRLWLDYDAKVKKFKKLRPDLNTRTWGSLNVNERLQFGACLGYSSYMYKSLRLEHISKYYYIFKNLEQSRFTGRTSKIAHPGGTNPTYKCDNVYRINWNQETDEDEGVRSWLISCWTGHGYVDSSMETYQQYTANAANIGDFLGYLSVPYGLPLSEVPNLAVEFKKSQYYTIECGWKPGTNTPTAWDNHIYALTKKSGNIPDWTAPSRGIQPSENDKATCAFCEGSY